MADEDLVFRDPNGGLWVPICPGERWKVRRQFRFPDGTIRYCRPKSTCIDLIPVNPEQLAALRRDLVAVGERLEACDSPDWLVVARAAALIDGLRFDFVSTGGANHAGLSL